MEVICLFLPSFITLYILKNELFKRNNFNIQSFLYSYVFTNLSINFTILVICKLLFKTVGYDFTVSFSIKYIVLSVILAIIYAYAFKNRYELIKKDIYIKAYKRLFSFIKKHNVLFVNVALFLSIMFLLLLFDLPLRFLSNRVSDFYSIFHLFPLLMSLSYIMLVFAIMVILPKVLRYIFASIVYLFNLILFITHFMMLNIKEEAFTIYDLANASEGMAYFNFLLEEINVKLILLIVVSIILFGCIIVFINKMNKQKTQYKRKLILFLIYTIIFVVIRSLSFITLEKYSDVKWDHIIYPRYYYENFINPKRSLDVCGLYEYTFRDINFYIDNKKENEVNIEEINSLFKNREISNAKNKNTGILKDKNLIMIMLESVDNIMLNEEAMPTLIDVMNKSYVFPKRYSQLSTGGSTIATEFTSLSGLFYSGKHYNIYNNTYNESIPNVFKDNGYYTNSIHENYGIYYNRNAFHKSLGFDNSYFVLDHKTDFSRYHDELLVGDDEIYQNIINKGDKDKFMSFIVTISSHGPYVNNGQCDAQSLSSEKECVNYLANRTDLFINDLIERLKKDKLLDDTVIVLYADHYAYAYNYTEDDRTYEKIDDNHIIQNLPLIVYSASIKHKEYNDILLDDVDILPTIFNLFGIDYNPNKYIGVDAFSLDHKNIVIFTDYSWYDGNIYSFNKGIDNTTEEYRKNTEYTKETLDLSTMLINSDYYKNKSNFEQ